MAVDYKKNAELVRTLTCPDCKAKKGEYCISPSGRGRPNHAARIAVAFRKGIIK